MAVWALLQCLLLVTHAGENIRTDNILITWLLLTAVIAFGFGFLLFVCFES